MKNTFLSILVFAAISTQCADSTLGVLAKHLAIPDAKRPPVAKQNFAHASLTKADAAKA